MVDMVFKFGVHTPLPGDIQTLPRSEVAAALVLLMHLASGTSVSLYSDSKVFVDSFDKGYQQV